MTEGWGDDRCIPSLRFVFALPFFDLLSNSITVSCLLNTSFNGSPYPSRPCHGNLTPFHDPNTHPWPFYPFTTSPSPHNGRTNIPYQSSGQSTSFSSIHGHTFFTSYPSFFFLNTRIGQSFLTGNSCLCLFLLVVWWTSRRHLLSCLLVDH